MLESFGDNRFQTTQWSLVEAARSSSEDERRRAREALVQRYMPPVYAFLRRKGLNPDDAADAAQGFFETVVLTRDLFSRANAASGRLRTWILTSLDHYLIDLHRKRCKTNPNSASFAFRSELLQLEEDRLDLSSKDDRDSFDRRWALRVLELAIDHCETHFEAAGKSRHWVAFRMRVLGPALSGLHPPELQTVARQAGFETPAETAAAIQVVKRRLAVIIEHLVVQELDSDTSPSEELAFFRSCISLPHQLG